MRKKDGFFLFCVQQAAVGGYSGGAYLDARLLGIVIEGGGEAAFLVAAGVGVPVEGAAVRSR